MTTSLPVAIPAGSRRRGLLPRGSIGLGFLLVMLVTCVATLPWTLGRVTPGADAAARGATGGEARYNAGQPQDGRFPPWWWPPGADDIRRLNDRVEPAALERIATRHGMTIEQVKAQVSGPVVADIRVHWPTHNHRLTYLLGSDALGRSLFFRCLTGGGISLGIGFAAAALSVLIGTVYGAVAAYAGGVVDALMMRIVDILYGLPYILLVVLVAVAVDAWIDNTVMKRVEHASAARRAYIQQGLERAAEPDRATAKARLEDQALDRYGTGELSASQQNLVNVVVLLVAIGGISWLTMARVIRGQVLSLKNQPFIEAARAMGVGWVGQFRRHLLPNLVGPIIVYATLTVPQAILQESFLSFLGIGVKPPLPSWGNLAAEGLPELNTYKSYWWLLVFPCLLLGSTLLALNFVGELLRERLDPKHSGSRAR